MGDKTAIQWTDASWNPTVGCWFAWYPVTEVAHDGWHTYWLRWVERRWWPAMWAPGFWEYRDV